ncbi:MULTISPECIES: hypothetical protein [unclassified Pseudomonas]|uniref:hypothetical protein n=1 Tax=unclassified Pseudomonas TaxID=196821 RepID=UPI001BB3AAF2|nr:MULTISPECIES: hypothetical protein [unclassified Pseudomonas]WLH62063.1 hypothetical protein PSH86_25665 [Pseudomonas sp. FP2300]BBH35407.1 hypothetical protein PBDP_4944 [Pseudomonas sp. St290]
MLYRGVSLTTHTASAGLIKVSGEKTTVTPKYDGKARHDGTFTYGDSIENAVNAQQIETGTWGSAFISTTRNKETAEFFATHDREGNVVPGVVYWIDDALFDRYGVIAMESEQPKFPEEQEVSIRPEAGVTIPSEVVFHVELIEPSQ